MTKGKSFRRLFMSKIDDDEMTLVAASAHCKIGVCTGQRWITMLRRTGNYFPLRVRKSIPGIMSLEHQDMLQIVIEAISDAALPLPE